MSMNNVITDLLTNKGVKVIHIGITTDGFFIEADQQVGDPQGTKTGCRHLAVAHSPSDALDKIADVVDYCEQLTPETIQRKPFTPVIKESGGNGN